MRVYIEIYPNIRTYMLSERTHHGNTNQLTTVFSITECDSCFSRKNDRLLEVIKYVMYYSGFVHSAVPDKAL